MFNRIWNTPGNGYAEKFKHVIEPTLTIQRTTAIDNFDRIVQLDGTDYTVGEHHAVHLRPGEPAVREEGSRRARS